MIFVLFLLCLEMDDYLEYLYSESSTESPSVSEFNR